MGHINGRLWNCRCKSCKTVTIDDQYSESTSGGLRYHLLLELLTLLHEVDRRRPRPVWNSSSSGEVTVYGLAYGVYNFGLEQGSHYFPSMSNPYNPRRSTAGPIIIKAISLNMNQKCPSI